MYSWEFKFLTISLYLLWAHCFVNFSKLFLRYETIMIFIKSLKIEGSEVQQSMQMSTLNAISALLVSSLAVTHPSLFLSKALNISESLEYLSKSALVI